MGGGVRTSPFDLLHTGCVMSLHRFVGAASSETMDPASRETISFLQWLQFMRTLIFSGGGGKAHLGGGRWELAVRVILTQSVANSNFIGTYTVRF